MNQQQFEDRLKKHQRIQKRTNLNTRLHALIDYETDRIVCITNNTNTLRSLSTILNVGEYPSCNMRKKSPWSTVITHENCIYWRWLDYNLISSNFEDFEEYYRCMILNEKASALDRLLVEINFIRNQQHNDTFLQEEVYAQKYLEASLYLNTNSAEGFLFLSSYAELRNITLREAANKIIAMRNFRLSYLNDTENLRMKYTELIIEEKDFFNLPNIITMFDKEAYDYASL